MYLLLGQLVYTSFAGKGFKTVCSPQVSPEIQQAFLQHVVSQHWDSYNPPEPKYRAAYIYQIDLEQTLFGWLYNDGVDELGRGNVPYFICYYISEPLFDFQLANIFTCLERGPVAILDRHQPRAYVKTKVLSNLWDYQPAKAGVSTPLYLRQQSYTDLRQGNLLELFVPIDAQESAVDFPARTYEQQMANLSIYSSYAIDGLELEPGQVLTADAATIAVDPIASESQSKPKLPLYQFYKQTLGKDRELESLIQKGSTNLLSKYKKNSTASRDRHPASANTNSGRLALAGNNFSQIDFQPLPLGQTVDGNAERLTWCYKNSQLWLKVGILASAVALGFSLYGLIHSGMSNTDSRVYVASQVKRNRNYKALAAVPNVPSGMFRYGGSTTFAPLRSPATVATIAQAQPQFDLLYTDPYKNRHGSTVGIQMLLAGKLSFAQSSRPIRAAELRQAQRLGFTLEQIPVAIDGIALYVNPQVAVTGLTLSQVKDIFTGKIVNWKQLGGSDLPIVPISRDPQVSGTADFLQEKVLAEENFGSNVRLVNTTTDAIRAVAKTPGGISYATASEAVRQQSIDPISLATISPLPLAASNGGFVSPFDLQRKNVANTTAFANGTYPLTRRLYIIVKRDGSVDERAGIAYTNLLFSEEGQQLVEQAGFAPLRLR
ncbi:PstS family phosphate ABC transporter substrate-binding protein [Scytonema millei]|uniref:Phosphate ABC transporter substrate-binding protein n=1 Tax=Scytonema millei VB511283 TaxID=1245923 RepID=A0A9X5I628_9CYAN|nr:phosphate ABC transporter substrate-binding protein [Scytonema millei]NHC36269.1 phosphate ABC transporter substrate-binding protein [Scytonema millei VB511283]